MKKDSKVKLRAVLEKLAPVEFNQVRYSSSLPCTRKLVGGKCGAPEAAGGNNPVSQPDMSEAETPAAANCNECAVRKTRLVFAVGDVTNATGSSRAWTTTGGAELSKPGGDRKLVRLLATCSHAARQHVSEKLHALA
ncbi:hypothetical protein PF004_g7861 [Phytophthora fragariae]|uniref:Uncharacterized protein n=1 Tax=Phytophthora fragariae TaxID=53985 RepID=A0A6G0P8M7_9STRA|nr:hypothetical protein PF004_g7861 [Phytophthora fragariae]